MCSTDIGAGEFTLTGEPRMEQRPIGDLVDALHQLGAQIDYLKQAGFPPVKVNATGLQGGDVSIAGSLSSQYLTALLMVAPLAQGAVTIHIDGELVSKPYIELTLQMMARFGVTVTHDNYRLFEIAAGQHYRSQDNF